MNRFKTKHFSKWAKKSDLADSDLLRACHELEKGLFAANLSGNVFKIRIAKGSRGKSSGYRTILAYMENVRIIYLYGFSKNERDNISAKELEAFKKLSKDYLALSSPQLVRAETMGILIPLEEQNAQDN
jgi:hypothetical protein